MNPVRSRAGGRSARACSVLVATLLLATACGLPNDESAQQILDVPYDLLATTTSTSTTVLEPEGPFELTLYFVSATDQSLVKVLRRQPTRPTPSEALAALFVGPLEGEQLPGAPEESAIVAPFSELLDPVLGDNESGLQTIVVSDEEAAFREAPRKQLATEVIVCTMTEFQAIGRVEFRDSIEAIPLSGKNTESIGTGALRSDFDDCLVPDEAIVSLAEDADGETDADGEQPDADGTETDEAPPATTT